MTHWILLFLAILTTGGTLRMLNATGHSIGGIGFFVVGFILYFVFVAISNLYYKKNISGHNVNVDTVPRDD